MFRQHVTLLGVLTYEKTLGSSEHHRLKSALEWDMFSSLEDRFFYQQKSETMLMVKRQP